MKKWWVVVSLCLLASIIGALQVFAEKNGNGELEWLKAKEFHPQYEEATVSNEAFVDVLEQVVGLTSDSDLDVTEAIDKHPDSSLNHGEAVDMLSHLFPFKEWKIDDENGNKPLKWGQALEYVQVVANQVYISGTYKDERVEGSVLINQPGVSLENVRIDGDLFITKGAAQKQTVLKSVKVNGEIYVDESVQNQVELIDSDAEKMTVYAAGEESSDWSLVWNDEFMASEIDSTKWSYDIGNWLVDEEGNGVSPGWGNNEKQYYTDSSKNSYIENGNLVIEAIDEKRPISDEFGSYDYTSAKLKTEGLYSKKYGKFEARMKLPEGQGYWPAFWMMPEDSVYGDWPTSGEIDIMEAAGNDTSKIGGTIHYGEEYPNNTYRGEEYHFPEGESYTGFHTYTVEWEPGEIRWYVDGQLYQTLNNWFSKGTDEATNYTFPAPFDQDFHMILNLAVGGWYGGDPDATTPFPGKMEVDYVRVYELTGREYMEPVEPSIEPEPMPEEAKQPLEDGNLIYDQPYDQGFTIIDDNEDVFDEMYWNYATLPDFGGQGNITTDVLDGKTYAKTSITNPGDALWSHQLIQKLSIGEGRTYKVSFDAKSDTNRSIMTKVSGGEERGYANYSGEETFTLTDTVQSYAYTFKQNQETDLGSRLEFNMGSVSSNPVWIGNVRVEDITDQVQDTTQKEPLPDGNHIYNGTFDQGDFSRLMYWDVVTQNEADAQATVDEDARVMQMNMVDGGTNPEDLVFKQTGLQFMKGSTYDITFRAKADQAGETMSINFMSQDGTFMYDDPKPISLNADWNTYTVAFDMSNDITDLEGQLQFQIGGADSDVYIDDVRMIQTSNTIDYSEVDMDPLTNGDFTSGMDGWTSYVHDDASGVIDVQQEALNVDITNGGNEAWSILAEHPSMSLSKDVTYRLTFDAKSSANRDMDVTIENDSYNRYLSEFVSLGRNYQTYTYEWQMPADDTVSLKYLMGQVSRPHTIQIDNVNIEVVVPE